MCVLRASSVDQPPRTGQERFGHMTRVYYKEVRLAWLAVARATQFNGMQAVGAMVVFDVTRSGTFDAVRKWKDDLDLNLSTATRKVWRAHARQSAIVSAPPHSRAAALARRRTTFCVGVSCRAFCWPTSATWRKRNWTRKKWTTSSSKTDSLPGSVPGSSCFSCFVHRDLARQVRNNGQRRDASRHFGRVQGARLQHSGQRPRRRSAPPSSSFPTAPRLSSQFSLCVRLFRLGVSLASQDKSTADTIKLDSKRPTAKPSAKSGCDC